MLEVGLVDIGLGNVESIDVSLRRSGINTSRITASDNRLPRVVVLPGIGHFSTAVDKLESSGIKNKLIDHSGTGGGIIGICLGMQLLGRGSAEGAGSGLGLIDYSCVNMSANSSESIPMTGWQVTELAAGEGWLNVRMGDRYYFMHDYGVPSTGSSFERMLHKNRDGIAYLAGVQQGNVIGFQFHPERSLEYGQRILANAVEELSR